MKLSARLQKLADEQLMASQPGPAGETSSLAQEAEQLELRVRSLELLAALLPPSGPLRIGCRRYGDHIVVWIDTAAGAREGSGPTLADALLSAAVAGPAGRKPPKNARHSGL